jgi:hypothetical protein
VPLGGTESIRHGRGASDYGFWDGKLMTVYYTVLDAGYCDVGAEADVTREVVYGMV